MDKLIKWMQDIMQMMESTINLMDVMDVLKIFGLIVLLVYMITSFRIRINKKSSNLINTFLGNRKYIKGLFVEVNETKELLRYFINGPFWKFRVVKDYNSLFDDEYGVLFKGLFQNNNVKSKLKSYFTIRRIYDELTNTLEFLKKVKKREIYVSENDKNAAIVLEINSRSYIEKIEKLKLRIEFLINDYVILKGTAGNGKTNLLCNIAEYLIKTKKVCIFINAKDITGNVPAYFYDWISVNPWKYNKFYWYVEALIYKFLFQKIYVIIDAVNENDSEDFYRTFPDFLNNILKFKSVKILLTCRSEYFDLKYKGYLVEAIEQNNVPYCYDIINDEYSSVAKDRLFEVYRNEFNFQGDISFEVKEKLYSQLLLMRIFFEVYKNSNESINTLNKYSIFQNYIKTIIGENKEYCSTFLNSIVEKMYLSQDYRFVVLPVSEVADMKGFIDESIVLTRKLVVHPSTIREEEKEEISFVFDEMRDYCVAKYVLNILSDENDNPMEEKIIDYLDNLTALNSVCQEGVINYIYYYYHKEGIYSFCEKILYRYIQPHDEALDDYTGTPKGTLNSWGLRLIFENDGVLQQYEKSYLKYIVCDNPGNELARLFAFLIKQELTNGCYNLDLYLEILCSIHNKKQFVKILGSTLKGWYYDRVLESDFVEIDMELSGKNIEGCKRFRRFVFLYLCCFDWNEKESVKSYFSKRLDKTDIANFVKEKIFFEDEDE